VRRVRTPRFGSRIGAVRAGESKLLRTLLTRPRLLLREKVAVLLGLAVGICVPYFTLQRLDVFPLRALPVTAVDLWIPFQPAWIWAYLSIALLVPIAPLLATRREQLMRYAKGLALLCLPCFAAFLVFPVEGPRPEVAGADALYELLVSWDRASNSLPSLHAGLVVYSLLFALRVLRDDGSVRGLSAHAVSGWTWGALILYSTLATKQHWAIDLPAGVLLACAAHALAWRDAQRVPGRDEVALLNL
jgi:membrane-associated phospholipid phosphatase